MNREVKLRVEYIVSDFVTINLGWFVFNIIRWMSLPAELQNASMWDWIFHDHTVVTGQVVIPLVMLLIYAVSGFYNLPIGKSRLEEAGNTAVMSFIGMLGIFFTVLINDSVPERLQNYELMLILWLLLALPCYVGRLFITLRQRRRRRMGVGLYDAIIIGNEGDAKALAYKLKRRGGLADFNVRGFVSFNPKPFKSDLPVYTIEEIDEAVDALSPRALIMAESSMTMKENMELIAHLFRKDIDIYVPVGLYRHITGGARVSSVVEEPLINISRARITPSTVNLKRIGDVVMSALALIVLAPLFLILAIAIKMDSHGKVFYRQERVGYHKKIFKIVKFRTMKSDAEPDGPALSTVDDPRVTRVGHVLRKYRLDELPQFWNVLRGDMSLVGPRPEREYFVKQIIARVPHYSLVHQVRPGITSWGMVRYGYAENVDEMVDRLKYDLLYLENISLAVDLKILFHTVHTVVTGKGV